MKPCPSPFARRPFHRRLSLALDRVIIALERSATWPDRREALRREKARLEQSVPTRKLRR
jgi:hypothetical protein